ncbi:MAG: potassium channel family protein [Chthoniobacterales bacterium]
MSSNSIHFLKLKKAPLILFATLFFLLFFGPVLNKWEIIPILLLGMSGKIIATKKIKQFFLILFSCLLVPIALTFASYLAGFFCAEDHSIISSVVLHIGIVSFLALYAVDGVAELMMTHKTNASEVLSALNAYIIFGLIYGELYALIAYFQTGAFTINDKISKASQSLSSMMDSWPYIYFSFITQTSVGYGDVTPISHLAQTVVISQAIFGQFYIAIVIAYLLRNYISSEYEELKELTEKPVPAKKTHPWIFSKKS